MKLSSFALSVLQIVSITAFAVDPEVKISSYLYAGSRTNAAEVCGKVTGLTEEWAMVQVTVDPKSKKPGTYQTVVRKDGAFCMTVVTYDGKADAQVWSPAKGDLSVRTAVEDATTK